MRFELTALIGGRDILERTLAVKWIRIIRLDDRLSLVPLTRPIAQALRAGAPGRPVAGFRLLDESLVERAQAASDAGPLAYVEAMFVGGIGGQSAIGWGGGAVALGPLHTGHTKDRTVPPIGEWPINKALRFLGVTAAGSLDEFDTMRLGRHSRVEEWLEERIAAPSPNAGRAYSMR